jgi:prevent-host-death family protein
MKQEIVSVSKAKARFLTLVRSLEEEGRAYVLIKDGEPVGALVPMDDYESYLETREIENDQNLMKQLRRAMQDERSKRLWTRDDKGRWLRAHSRK